MNRSDLNGSEKNPASDGVILYKYLTVEGAIDLLQNRRIRVSLPNALNDPFEIIPGIANLPSGYPDTRMASINTSFVDAISSVHGIVCFSKTPSNLLMWSHYTAGHTGVVLELGCTPNNDLIDVTYDTERPQLDYLKLPLDPARKHPIDVITRCLTTKSDNWRYEEEVRCIVALDACRYDNGHYYHSLESNPGFVRRVILGCKCSESEKTFERLAKQSGYEDIEVVRARLSLTHYAVEIPDLERGDDMDPQNTESTTQSSTDGEAIQSEDNADSILASDDEEVLVEGLSLSLDGSYVKLLKFIPDQGLWLVESKRGEFRVKQQTLIEAYWDNHLGAPSESYRRGYMSRFIPKKMSDDEENTFEKT